MKASIKVICTEGFEIFNNDKGLTLSAIVEEKEYDAILYEPTEEYFAKDSEDREFLVGEINFDGKLILVEYFKLAE